MEKRIIKLPKGGDLEVDMTPRFLDIIKEYFDLDSTESITDDQIRMFVYGSTKSALDTVPEHGYVPVPGPLDGLDEDIDAVSDEPLK